MALDEPKQDDEVYDDQGITFLINKTLLQEAKPITVDFISTPRGAGFKLSSGLITQQGGGCGSSCSSC